MPSSLYSHTTQEAPTASLTESRIGRILRPLITKCATLATLSNKSSASTPLVAVTYTASRPGRPGNSRPSRPRNQGISPPVSTNPTVSVDIQRRISDVRVAFKNVLQALYGSPRARDKTRLANSRVPSLGDLCGSVLGANMTQRTQSRREFEDDLLEREASNAIYAGIPEAYRRSVVSAQALDIVLSQCPRNSTLLSDVLQACLSHNLDILAAEVLEEALYLAVEAPRASSSSSVPITATSAFSDLLSTWSTYSGNLRIFASVASTVLFQAQNPPLYTSRPVSKVVQELAARDIPALVGLCFAPLAEHWSEPCEGREELRATCISLLSEHLLSGKATEEDNRFIELLASEACRAQIRLDNRSLLGKDETRSPRLLLYLVLQLGASSRGWNSPSSLKHCIAFLRKRMPTTSTFQAFSKQILASPASISTLHDSKKPVALYGHFLRKHALYKLEASFLASVLHEFENLAEDATWTLGATQQETMEWRHVLMESVQQAEDRAYGSVSASAEKLAGKTPVKRFRREEAIDCWVAQTPAPKKRKFTGKLGLETRQSRLMSTVLSPRRHSTGVMVDKAKKRLKPTRRRQSFGSILGDAVSNRDKLHRQQKPVEKSGRRPSLERPTIKDWQWAQRPAPPAWSRKQDVCSDALAGSDDDLDLLAPAARSSPTCRR